MLEADASQLCTRDAGHGKNSATGLSKLFRLAEGTITL
jgi:hypothetical protein